MIEQLNTALFLFINQFAGKNLLIDDLAIIAAKYMPLIIIIGLGYLWIKNQNKRRDIVLYAVYAAIIGLTLNYIIGIFYFHPRPFTIPIGTLLFPYTSDSSFPSDHATLMFSVSWILIYFKETRSFGYLFLILGFIGGFARVFSGIHFPLDIAGSFVVAIISAFIIIQLKDKLIPFNMLFKEIYNKLTRTSKNRVVD